MLEVINHDHISKRMTMIESLLAKPFIYGSQPPAIIRLAIQRTRSSERPASNFMRQWRIEIDESQSIEEYVRIVDSIEGV